MKTNKESLRLQKLKALNADHFLILAEEWRNIVEDIVPDKNKMREMFEVLEKRKKSRKK